MKKEIAFAFIALSWSIAFTQNVGIGTLAPKARLHEQQQQINELKTLVGQLIKKQ